LIRCTTFSDALKVAEVVEQLHRLIDTGAKQEVINERIVGLMEQQKQSLERIGTDHEKRLRYLERTVAWALGGVGAISAIVMLLKEFVHK
jgi:hypothetical protein